MHGSMNIKFENQVLLLWFRSGVLWNYESLFHFLFYILQPLPDIHALTVSYVLRLFVCYRSAQFVKNVGAIWQF